MGREPGIGPAQLTCPNIDTDHSDQGVRYFSLRRSSRVAPSGRGRVPQVLDVRRLSPPSPDTFPDHSFETTSPQVGLPHEERGDGLDERSPYGRLRETLGLVPMRMVSALTALEVGPSDLVTG